MGGPTQPAGTPGGNLAARAGGPAPAGRLTRTRLGESAADYLRHVERRTLGHGDIVTRPHRAHLDSKRVRALASSLVGFTGMAVAYEPGTGFVLIGGEHRLAAHRTRGDKAMEVYVLHSWRDFVAWMMDDCATSAQARHAGWTRYTEVDAAHLSIKAVGLLNPARSEQPYDDVAEYTGTHEGAVANTRWLLGVAADDAEQPEIRQYAAEQLKVIGLGKGGAHGVRERVKQQRDRLAAAAAPKMPADKQRGILGDTMAKLAGITAGLETIGELNPELTRKELDDWFAQLGRINTKLIRLRTKLKERAQA